MSTAEPLSTERSRTDAGHAVCFSVRGIADPSLLPRVAGLWAKRGLTPQRWHSAFCGPADKEMYIDLEVAGLTADLATQIASEMRQIWGVSQVLMSLPGDAAPA